MRDAMLTVGCYSRRGAVCALWEDATAWSMHWDKLAAECLKHKQQQQRLVEQKRKQEEEQKASHAKLQKLQQQQAANRPPADPTALDALLASTSNGHSANTRQSADAHFATAGPLSHNSIGRHDAPASRTPAEIAASEAERKRVRAGLLFRPRMRFIRHFFFCCFLPLRAADRSVPVCAGCRASS